MQLVITQQVRWEPTKKKKKNAAEMVTRGTAAAEVQQLHLVVDLLHRPGKLDQE